MQQLKKIWADPYLRFVILFVGLYLLFNYFNEFYIGITNKGGLYSGFLDEHLNYIEWWRSSLLKGAASILHLFGYTAITNETDLLVVGKGGIRLIYTCLGYGLMSVFAAFCLSFPRPFKHRLIFLLIGLLFIQFVNVLRFVLLPLFWDRKHPFLGMDHHDLFNIIIYLLLFGMCYLWIKYSIRVTNAKNSA